MLSQTTTLFAFEFSKPCRRQFSKNNKCKENDDYWNDYDDYDDDDEASNNKM